MPDFCGDPDLFQLDQLRAIPGQQQKRMTRVRSGPDNACLFSFPEPLPL